MKNYWNIYRTNEQNYHKYYEIILESLCELNKDEVTFEHPLLENFYWDGKFYKIEIKKVRFNFHKINGYSNLMFCLKFIGDIYVRKDKEYIKIKTDENISFIDRDNFILYNIIEKLRYLVSKKKEDESYPRTLKVTNKDIIITDPCYIRKSSIYDNEVIDNSELYDIKHELHDLINKNGWSEDNLSIKQFFTLYKKTKKLSKLNQLESQKKYAINKEKYISFEKEIEKGGVINYLISNTIYGDWSCTTFDSDTKQPIGEFCADGGEVGVFLLDEVLKYNPDFNYHIENPWSTTLIKNFSGVVSIVKRHNEGIYEDDSLYHKKGEKWEEDSIHVIGKGNINFETRQTGF